MLLASDETGEADVDIGKGISQQTIVFATSYLYLCPRLDSAPLTARPAATIILAASPKTFDIEGDGVRRSAGVAIVRPFVAKRVHAPGTPLISIGIHPNHPAYRKFNLLAGPGILVHPHSAFDDLLGSLRKAADHQPIDADTGASLMRRAIEAVTADTPPLAELDSRVKQAMALVGRDHRTSLDELAEATCLSYFRLSHLFKEELGISLRHYVLSLKIDTATHHLGRGGTLTDAAHAGGFCDSAHLTKVWVKWFGGPPTAFLKKDWFSTDRSRP